MPEPGSLFTVKIYSIHLFKNKKNLIDEFVATRKMWAQIFRQRTTIEKGEVVLFLEEEFIPIPDPDEFLGLTLWKVLYLEEIGWIEYDKFNVAQK